MSTQPPTRDPVGHGRAFVEGAAILTPLATIIAWALTLLPLEIPEYVRNAIVGLVVTTGTLVFSELRNRKHAISVITPGGLVFVSLLFVPLASLLFVACLTWDGDGFKMLAANEIVELQAVAPEEPIATARCDALRLAAVSLRNSETGTSKSLNAPFFAGKNIPELGTRFDRMASICYEFARRDEARGVAPSVRADVRGDWLRAWRDGRALQGGPE